MKKTKVVEVESAKCIESDFLAIENDELSVTLFIMPDKDTQIYVRIPSVAFLEAIQHANRNGIFKEIKKDVKSLLGL